MADDDTDIDTDLTGDEPRDDDNWVVPVPPTGMPAYAVMPWRLFLRLRGRSEQPVKEAETLSGEDISIRNIEDMALLTALNRDNPFDTDDNSDLPEDDEFGEDEDMPLAVLDRLLDGEHPLKVFRRHRGLSQKELAERTGLNATYLSQIETRKRGGSTRVYRLLAAALNVDIGDLIE